VRRLHSAHETATHRAGPAVRVLREPIGPRGRRTDEAAGSVLDTAGVEADEPTAAREADWCYPKGAVVNDYCERLCCGTGQRSLQSGTGRSTDEPRPHDQVSARSGEGQALPHIGMQVEPLGTTLKMAIDRIVSELAEADSWEGLAQRAAKRRE
jgi:hypothetical protein